MPRKKEQKIKLVVITGPTAVGKTSLAIKLAKKFNGEIVSADSRQVYKGMDIGTGKASKQEQRRIKHHLLDIASPKREFNVSQFKKYALKAIAKICQQEKTPFLVGGSGFWIQAVIDNLEFPYVKPNKALRQKLQRKTVKQLFSLLQKLDPQRAKSIDRNNPYRLIRAIEIVKTTKQPVPKLKKRPLFDLLILGITYPREKLYKLIDQRLTKRIQQGLIAEVKKLKQQGISWQRLYNIGLEYRYVSLFLQKKFSRQEMERQLKNAIHHYAKRQMTWLKKDKRIHWIKNQTEAEKLLNRFLLT